MIAQLLRNVADWLDPPPPMGYEAFNMLPAGDQATLWDMLADEVSDMGTRDRVEDALQWMTLEEMKYYLEEIRQD